MVVTGYDDRYGCGYVLSTGPDMAGAAPGSQRVSHRNVTVAATPELAAILRDALLHRPIAQLTLGGPGVALTLDDRTVLGWLRYTIGGVLTVTNGPR